MGICIFLGLNTTSFSQNWLWAKSVSGNINDRGYSICTDAGGNVFVTGGFSNSSFNIGSFTLSNVGNNDVFIAKYDANGNVLWAKSAGGTGEDYGSSISTDIAGNIFVTGCFNSSSITIGNNTLTNIGSLDIFLTKFDANGNVLWAKSAGGINSDLVFSVCTDTAENVFITGIYYSPTIIFGSTAFSNLGGYDFYLAKYDANGNALWAESENSNYDLISNTATTDESGNVFITGSFQSPSITLGSVTLINSSSPYVDFFLAKYDPTGNVLWAKSAGGTNSEVGLSVSTDNQGNVFVTGDFKSPDITFDSTILTNASAGNYDAFIAKYDGNGNMLWAKGIAGTDLERGWSVSADIGGSAYVTGSFMSPAITFDSNTLTRPSGSDSPMFIIKYDPIGNVQCSTSLASGGDYKNNICTNTLGDVYIGGDFSISPFNIGTYTLTLGGQTDIFVAKYSCGLSASVSQTSVLCNGTCTGTANATPLYGISPFTYSWNTIPLQTTQAATELCAGNYIVTITDSTNSTASALITITEPQPLTLVSSYTATICGTNSGTATVNAAGGTAGYSYFWDPASQTTQTIINLEAGTYTSTVTDANGCIQTSSVTIPSNAITISTASIPSACDVNTGSATVTPNNGTPPFVYLWNTGETSQTITGLGIGTYTVMVSDSNDCTQSQAIECSVNSEYDIPSAFSPNNDGHNDLFILQGWKNCVTDFSIFIFDRFGEKVYESSDPAKGWDGTLKGKFMDPGVFVYYIIGTGIGGKKISKKGNISLIK